MKMPKPTDADRARFAALVPVAPGVETKPMFGNLGAFVNGNMFMGLFATDLWKFCGNTGSQWLQAANTLAYLRDQGEPDWWARSSSRR